MQDVQAEVLLGENINYIITRKSVNGFRIMLNKPASLDVTFSWIALAVKQPRLVVSEGLGTPEVVAPEPVTIPDVAGEVTDEPTVSDPPESSQEEEQGDTPPEEIPADLPLEQAESPAESTEQPTATEPDDTEAAPVASPSEPLGLE